jgi:MYXO-CTERM domain-containing protein
VTSFHDISAEEITPGVVLPVATNGFNAWMALGIMRTLYHVTGDEAIGRFYYEELIGTRDYLDVAEATLRYMYTGNDTNYSNVNMAFVAGWGILRYESDAAIAAQAQRILEEQLYAPGLSRDANDLGQSFFDFLYAGFRTGGALGDADGMDARDDGNLTLAEFPDAPYWNPVVENCDPAEVASLTCTGSDGTSLPLSPVPGRGGEVVALDAVPMRIRPPENFGWVRDPHDVNGGGGDRLNPAGEFHGAYWMGRLLEAGSDGSANVSPRARLAPPPLPASDGGAGADAGVDGGTGGGGGGGGCGCRVAAGAQGPWGWLLVVAALGATRRRRS